MQLVNHIGFGIALCVIATVASRIIIELNNYWTGHK